ncbi:hypothetical protein FRC10_011278 [Ceratobasidium sp. 414]|nr:hypothetical protein FRC10_011278 [Ceratobasidium sp. 414]
MMTVSSLSSLSALALLWPTLVRAQACVGTISSMADVAAAVKCQTVNINGFAVPPNTTLNLSLLDNTTVNMLGNISFGVFNWGVNGNGYFFDGNGPAYWDGLGGNGGVVKPHPMMKLDQDVRDIHALGDLPNANSGGLAAGHNTDGFDCSTTDLVIENSFIRNQDDCIAINKGNNITFHKNTCIGGHGVSVGSIDSNVVAANIEITGNTIIDNDQALRIKTKAAATNSTVANITFSGNTATGCNRFGVIIDQSYSATLGTPGNGVVLSNVEFVGTMNDIQVNDNAMRVAVNCGNSSCTGAWDWNKLNVTGGVPGPVNYAGIINWTQ